VDGTYPFAVETYRRVRPGIVTSKLIDRTDSTVWDHPFVVPAEWNPRPWHPGKQETDAISSRSGSSDVPTPIPAPAPVPVNGVKKRSGSPVAKYRRRQSKTIKKSEELTQTREGVDSLNMRIPKGLTVRRIAEMMGLDTPVPVINVVTQDKPKEKWTMQGLADYFESPERDTLYNCISCEVSKSPLGEQISQPQAVRDCDLVGRVWKHAGDIPKPQVGKYVLMSVSQSFTDFHVDFAGSSVFYHIYEGQKTFLLIPPSDRTLKAYEKWSSSESMNYTFLPDLLPDVPCTLLRLDKGDTLFMPSGWIHAVYTPVDSIVVGGNFLTRSSFYMQMRVHAIEEATGVPQIMRYPQYTALMWCMMFDYIESDRMSKAVEKDVLAGIIERRSKLKPYMNARTYTEEELKGLPSLIDFLYGKAMILMGVTTTSPRLGVSKKTIESVKKAIPWPINRNPLLYVKHFARWCLWKRAIDRIVTGGEKIPDWAHADWYPPIAGSDRTTLLVSREEKIKSDATVELEDRYNLSLTPMTEDGLEDFVYFPVISGVSTGMNGNHPGDAPTDNPSLTPVTSSSVTPSSIKNGKRRLDNDTHGSSKKTKATRRNPQPLPLLPAAEDNRSTPTEERITLTDGSIYVKKLSNLGPPRIGCESCRQKKTGCKHKDEIRKLIVSSYVRNCGNESSPQAEKPNGEQTDDIDLEFPSPGGVLPAGEESDCAPVSRKGTPSGRRNSTTPGHSVSKSMAAKNPGVNGPPIGYKGRKPSCEDCKVLKVIVIRILQTKIL
jgi:F-box/leucine-rich repeat protein 10/11